MSTLANESLTELRVTGVGFSGNVVFIQLNDGRDIGLHLDRIKWLRWLATATPAQRQNWSLEPNGFAVYWEDLDDGIELRHILGPAPVNQKSRGPNLRPPA